MAETPDRCNPDSNFACPGFTKCSPAPVSTAIISTGSVETFERSAIKSAAAVTGLVCVGYLQYLQFDVVDAVAQEQSLHGIGHLSSTTQCGPIQRAPSGVVVDDVAAKYRSRTTVSNDGRSVSARSFLACPSQGTEPSFVPAIVTCGSGGCCICGCCCGCTGTIVVGCCCCCCCI